MGHQGCWSGHFHIGNSRTAQTTFLALPQIWPDLVLKVWFEQLVASRSNWPSKAVAERRGNGVQSRSSSDWHSRVVAKAKGTVFKACGFDQVDKKPIQSIITGNVSQTILDTFHLMFWISAKTWMMGFYKKKSITLVCFFLSEPCHWKQVLWASTTAMSALPLPAKKRSTGAKPLLEPTH